MADPKPPEGPLTAPQLIDALNEVTLRTRDLSDRLDFTGQIAQKIAGVLPKSLRSSDLLFASMNNLISVVGSVITKGLDFQKKTLSVNKLLGDSLDDNSAQLKRLPGDLFTKLESSFAFEAMGLKNVGDRTLDLSNRLKITGQDQKIFQRLVQKQIALGGLSIKDTEQLSQRTLLLSRGFEVQSGKLISAMDILSENMLKFGVMGITKQVSDLAQSLGAQFPQVSEQISQMINILADPRTPTTVLARLGAVQFARELRMGMIAGKAGERRTLAIIAKMAAHAERFTAAGAGTIGEVEQMFLDLIGPAGQLSQVINKQLGAGPRDMVMNRDKLMDDIGLMVDDFVSKFGIHILTFFQHIQPMLTGLMAVISFLETRLRLFSIAITVLTARMIVDGAKSIWRSMNLNNNIRAVILALNSNTAATTRASLMRGSSVGGAVVGALGPMALVIGALLLIGFAMKKGAEADATREERELQEAIARAKDRAKSTDVVTSRFAALSSQLLRDAVFRASMRESIVLDALGSGFVMVTDAVKGTTDAVGEGKEADVNFVNRGQAILV